VSAIIGLYFGGSLVKKWLIQKKMNYLILHTGI
jgi:hypothetical protein